MTKKKTAPTTPETSASASPEAPVNHAEAAWLRRQPSIDAVPPAELPPLPARLADCALWMRKAAAFAAEPAIQALLGELGAKVFDAEAPARLGDLGLALEWIDGRRGQSDDGKALKTLMGRGRRARRRLVGAARFYLAKEPKVAKALAGLQSTTSAAALIHDLDLVTDALEPFAAGLPKSEQFEPADIDLGRTFANDLRQHAASPSTPEAARWLRRARAAFHLAAPDYAHVKKALDLATDRHPLLARELPELSKVQFGGRRKKKADAEAKKADAEAKKAEPKKADAKPQPEAPPPKPPEAEPTANADTPTEPTVPATA
jgi:hypothetical protein